MAQKRCQPVKKSSRGEPPNFLGQHFMHNKKLIAEIVNQANITREDTVLELGAGKGALTSFLSQRAGKVLAVEYDHELVDILKQKFPKTNITIIHGDILRIHLPREPFVVASNIPYAITTPIMKKLLSNPCTSFQRGVIVMEKGAAKRFTAAPVKDPYVISWRMWFELKYVRTISRRNFSPPPSVDSAMVMVRRRDKPIVPYGNYRLFQAVAQHGLKHPELPIDLALRGVFTSPQLQRLKRNLEITAPTAIGALSEQQWGVIFDTMVKYVPKFLWPRAKL